MPHAAPVPIVYGLTRLFSQVSAQLCSCCVDSLYEQPPDCLPKGLARRVPSHGGRRCQLLTSPPSQVWSVLFMLDTDEVCGGVSGEQAHSPPDGWWG